MTFVLFILIFGVVVISHEFGHFLVAKSNGIHVVEFAIGMGPTIFPGKRRRRSIPLSCCRWAAPVCLRERTV